MKQSTASPVRAEAARPAAIKGAKPKAPPKARRKTADAAFKVEPATKSAIDKVAGKPKQLSKVARQGHLDFASGVQALLDLVASIRKVDHETDNIMDIVLHAECETMQAIADEFDTVEPVQFSNRQAGFLASIAVALLRLSDENWSPWPELEQAGIASPPEGEAALKQEPAVATPDVTEAQPEPIDFSEKAEVRRGAQAFRQLLIGIEALPQVLIPGCVAGDDDSMRHNFEGAESVIAKVMVEEAFAGSMSDYGRGVVTALGRVLIGHVNGIDAGPSDDVEADLDYLLHTEHGDVPAIATSEVQPDQPAEQEALGGPSPVVCQVVLDWIKEHREQAWALATSVGNGLARFQEEAKADSSGVFLELQLCTLLEELLANTDIEESCRTMLMGSDATKAGA